MFATRRISQIRNGIVLARYSKKWGVHKYIPIKAYPKLTRKAYKRTLTNQ